jgi:hypothetical protein
MNSDRIRQVKLTINVGNIKTKTSGSRLFLGFEVKLGLLLPKI